MWARVGRPLRVSERLIRYHAHYNIIRVRSRSAGVDIYTESYLLLYYAYFTIIYRSIDHNFVIYDNGFVHYYY